MGGQHGGYQAMMSVRMIALDNQTGVMPVWVEENWRRMMVKCVLRGTGQEAK